MQLEKYVIYIMIGLALICIASFRPEGMDNDFYTYVIYILNYDDKRFEMFVEPSFRMISKLFMNVFGNYRSVFFIFALMGVTIKLFAIKRLSSYLFAPLCIYIGNYFIQHEFTQIRVGVAVGFIMLALSYQIEKKRVVSICLICMATIFHYSSLSIIPMLFMSTDDITPRKRIIWGLIIPFGYLLYFMHFGISSLPIPFMSEKLELYNQLRDVGMFDEANVFNILLLLKIVIFYYCLYFYDFIKDKIPSFSICMKLMAISIFCFVAFTDLPVLSFRISELYGFAEIIIFSSIIYTVKPQWVGTLITTSLGVALLCLHSFIDHILVIM